MVVESELFFVCAKGSSGVEALNGVLEERRDRGAVAVEDQIELEVIGVLRSWLLVCSGDLHKEGEWQMDLRD